MIRRKADQENSLTRHSFGIVIPRLLDYSDVFSAARHWISRQKVAQRDSETVYSTNE